MPQGNALQSRLDKILSGRDKGERLQTDLITKAAVGVPPRSQFTPFDLEELERATDLASSFMAVADQEGLEEAVNAIERAQSDERIAGLVQYATMLFLTHHPQARESLRLKPLEYRQPLLTLSSQATIGPLATLAAANGIQLGGATPPEDRISFWREDPLLNEHHEHWHLVYPTRGRPNPAGHGYQLGDRHGELFAYMHQQMIARYDAERLAVGVARLEPFDNKPFANLSAAIPQGYDPGFLAFFTNDPVVGSGVWYVFRNRPTGASISDLMLDETSGGGPNWATRPGAKIGDQSRFANNIYDANRSGRFEANGITTPVSIDNLGDTVEANLNSVDYYGDNNNTQPPPDPPFPNNKEYGNLHNDGHIHLMLFDNKVHYGVMAATTTAVRDPIFFRWHKLIDNIFFDWQERQAPHDFSTGPEVRVHDIILCRKEDLVAPFDGQKIAQAFAYSDDPANNQWDKDFTSTIMTLSDGQKIATTDELITEMLQRQINLQDPQGNETQTTIDYLSHEDFCYFIRVQNLSDQPLKVTVRMFLAPETEIEDRRSWIEMDRFLCHLDGDQRAVVFQPAEFSTVIRKPALKPMDLTPDDEPSPKRESQAWCDCGWPYTMLLPRGTKDGMDFQLVVMLSDGEDLALPNHMSEHLDECGTSISYCGLQDMKYPDKQPMGYPFDRRFNESISATVAKYNNWSSRKIKIRCRHLP